MAGHTDDPHIMAEILAAELGADAELLRNFQQFGFKLNVPDRMAILISRQWEMVQISGGCQFNDF